MPTDPNARGNSILSDILKAMNKQNDLLAAQNKILDKMEKHARPTAVTSGHPYLEPSPRPTVGDDYVGPYGSGPSQDGR